jgi:hypothetical protein
MKKIIFIMLVAFLLSCVPPIPTVYEYSGAIFITNTTSSGVNATVDGKTKFLGASGGWAD